MSNHYNEMHYKGGNLGKKIIIVLNNNDFFCLSIQAESNIYSPFVQEAVVPAVLKCS